jgi:hypothetical protein
MMRVVDQGAVNLRTPDDETRVSSLDHDTLQKIECGAHLADEVVCSVMVLFEEMRPSTDFIFFDRDRVTV